MAYVLLPTTKGQKMMIVIGKGGEGKSRIGRVLRVLLGDSMNTGSIQKVEVDRFARADLEWKLLMQQGNALFIPFIAVCFWHYISAFIILFVPTTQDHTESRNFYS